MRRLINNVDEFVATWNAAASAEDAAKVLGLTTQQAIQQAYNFRGRGLQLKKFSDGHEFLKCKHCGNVFRSYKSNQRQYCSKTCSDIYASDRAKTHGQSYSRLHGIWCHMKTRCLCQTSNAYPYYGGRGITVCQQWQDSFEAFRDWALANGYQDDLEIDRREVNGNYEPGNCRWVTRGQQMANTRKRCDGVTSRFKGVSRNPGKRTPYRYRAQINRNGRNTFLGVFDTEEEAALAYDVAAIKERGEFAVLNFPERRKEVSSACS